MTRKNASPTGTPPTRSNKPLDRVYDVFLSHRYRDAALVEELNDYIEQTLHYEAYVDWKDSLNELDRDHVSEKTAEYLRGIMRHASSLIFVVGPEAAGSKWMPWELGFFDGRQSARRIAIYLPDGVELPAEQEYLGIYPLIRKDELADFLAAATVDVAAMDSATSDQWLRHLSRAMTRPDDYWLSVLQWQFGFAANLLTRDGQAGLRPDEQPRDEAREPAGLYGPWLQALRQCQHIIADQRRRLETQQRNRRDGSTAAATGLWPDPLAPFAAWLGGNNAGNTAGLRAAQAEAAPLPAFGAVPDWQQMLDTWQQAMLGGAGSAPWFGQKWPGLERLVTA